MERDKIDIKKLIKEEIIINVEIDNKIFRAIILKEQENNKIIVLTSVGNFLINKNKIIGA